MKAGIIPLIATALTLHQGKDNDLLVTALSSLISIFQDKETGFCHGPALLAGMEANVLPLIRFTMDVFKVGEARQ